MSELKWVLKFDELRLVLGDSHFASVWPNGTWHTWDSEGNGMENSAAETVQKAMEEAAQSSISQKLIVTRQSDLRDQIEDLMLPDIDLKTGKRHPAYNEAIDDVLKLITP